MLLLYLYKAESTAKKSL